MRTYTEVRPDLLRVRMIRDATDSLKADPSLRNAGLAVRREIAVRAVDAAMPPKSEVQS